MIIGVFTLDWDQIVEESLYRQANVAAEEEPGSCERIEVAGVKNSALKGA